MNITDVRVRKVTKEGKMKVKKDCLSPCRAERQWMANIGILHIR